MILVKPGDLVISGINVAKGAIGVYEGTDDVTATIHYSTYKFDTQQINVEYFKRFVKSSEFIRLLQQQVKGGIKTEIKAKHLLPLEIALPDVATQQSVVDFFQRTENEGEELASEIAVQRTLLQQLWQAILQEAVQGKLTEAWRQAHLDVEPALELLKRIQAEKAQLIKQGKIKKQKPFPPIKDDDILFELPEGWIWCRLGELIYENPRNGYSPKSVNYETSVRNLRLGAVTYGTFDPSEYKYIDEDIDEDSYLWLRPGDILIQRSNSIDYVGVSAIYSGKGKEFIYPDLMMKVCPVNDFIRTEYLHIALSCFSTRQYFRDNAKGAQKSMPKINQGTVINTKIALPPLVEQSVIIKKMNVLRNFCNQLEQQITQSQTNAEQLMQAVLREAFTTSA
jgi:type I restriction enzyme S subunit